jgi:carboxyl-terminal processing protease
MICAMRRLTCALLFASGIAQTPLAAAMARPEIEATLAAAMTQIVNQYVDPVDSRILVAHGLQALKALPDADHPSRQAAIEQSVLAAQQAEGITPQAYNLASEILRFADGAPRETALNAALRGMVASLDAYSRVATPAELAPPPASVGLELTMRDGALTVVRPLPGSPGERAGIQAGDIVTKIDGRATESLPLPEAVALLRGTPGTPVMVALRRAGAGDTIVVQPVRGPVQAPPTVRWEMHGAVAVIRVAAFDSTTGGKLREAFDAVSARADAPLAGLVLDLRGNAGGLLDVSEQVAGLVLREGSRIGSLLGRTPADARPLRARDHVVPHDVPVVVLVDRRTGAGAEIVAAALQDHRRALLIGAKTVGAGTIQTVLALPADQGALVLTTARVHRAGGDRLDAVGVSPDLLLDDATRQIAVHANMAADFNPTVLQQVRTAVATAPAGADVAVLAALAALKPATGTPQ